jgi:hypothetical protein
MSETSAETAVTMAGGRWKASAMGCIEQNAEERGTKMQALFYKDLAFDKKQSCH